MNHSLQNHYQKKDDIKNIDIINVKGEDDSQNVENDKNNDTKKEEDNIIKIKRENNFNGTNIERNNIFIYSHSNNNNDNIKKEINNNKKNKQLNHMINFLNVLRIIFNLKSNLFRPLKIIDFVPFHILFINLFKLLEKIN